MKWIEMHPNPSPPIYITSRKRNLFWPLRFGEKRQLPNIKNRSIHGSVHHTIWLENHWFIGWIFDTQVISSPQLRHCPPTKEEGTSHFLRFCTNDGLWWVSKQQNRRICGLEIWKFNLSEAFLKHTRIVMPRVAYQSLTVELGYGFISWIRLNPGTTWLTCSFFFPPINVLHSFPSTSWGFRTAGPSTGRSITSSCSVIQVPGIPTPEMN